MAFLTVEHISKTFPGVRALDDVSVEFEKASVHAVMGENGAGKSTLGKIIAGVYTADQGVIKIEGQGSQTYRLPNCSGIRDRSGPPGTGFLSEHDRG
jgi:ABC-type sugar transport system ATPase subunit